MKLLAEALTDLDAELSELYRGLLASEARHHSLYVDLAKQIFDSDEVMARLKVLSAHESQVIMEPASELRMHS